MNALELSHIRYRYSVGTPFEKEALKDVSVSFRGGAITGLIGHTGSGKSTLVQMFNGLLRPESGTVCLFGEDIWAKPAEIRKVRFRVGLVMQYPEYQLFDETVRADIAFGPKNMALDADEIAVRVRAAAKAVGLTEDLLDKSPFDLSGGQKRRAAIAGVLAMRPEVLVLDEPAAGLDPRGRREILGGLRKYQEENNATVILVSHSMEDMAVYCDDVVVMSDGQVLTCGSTAQVFSDPDLLTSVGLDVPQVAKITRTLQKMGIPLQGELYTVSGVRDAVLRLLAEKKGGERPC